MLDLVRALFSHVVAILTSGSLLLVCTAVGLAVLRRSRTDTRDTIATTALSIVFGMGVAGTLILVVAGLFGVGRFQSLIPIVVCALAASRELPRAILSLQNSIRILVRKHTPRGGRRLAILGLSCLISLLAMLALPPAVDWDSLAYHLAIPAEWLARGELRVPPDNYHVAFIGLAHMMYLPLLALGVPAAINVFNALLLLTLGFLTFACARRHFGAKAAKVAFWLLWASPVLLLVGTSPRIDVTLALFLLAAHHLILRAWRAPSTALAALAGCAIGMSVGVKHTAIAFAVGLCSLFALIAFVRCRAKLVSFRRLLATFATAALIASAPWMTKNAMLVGAPFYPFGAATKVEPWLVALHVPDGTPRTVPPAVYELHERIRRPFNLRDLAVRPERLAPDGDAPLSFPNFAFLLVPVAFITSRPRLVAAWALPALSSAGLLLLVSSSTSLRYMIPVIPPLTIVAAAAIAYAQLGSSRVKALLPAALLAVFIIPSLAIGQRLRDGRQDRFLTGSVSPELYARRYWETAAYTKAVDWMNSHLTVSDTVAFLFEARGFHVEIPHRKDMLLRNWSYLSVPGGVDSCFDRVNVSHVLVNDHAVRFFADRGARLRDIGWDGLTQLENNCLSLVYADDGFRIFKVRSVGKP